MVINTARASATTRRGVRYFFHPPLPRDAASGLSPWGGNGFVTGAADSAGAGEADIKFAPFACQSSSTQKPSTLFVFGPRALRLSTRKFNPGSGPEEVEM